MKYTIGIDFGTASGRAVLVEVKTGKEVAVATKTYSHGVLVEYLPDGKTKLPHDWALQHPADYLEVLQTALPEVLKKAQVSAADVIGIGIDFTSCTVLPVDKNLTPLCLLKAYEKEPHAYVKLWKHHAATKEASKLNQVATKRGEAFLARYGGKISSEWAIPKIWQILNEAPQIYEAMDQFLEAADWVVSQLVGKVMRNSCTAGYKAIWHKQGGYPSAEFFKALDPRLENVICDKFKGDIHPIGTKAGELTKEGAKLTGLLAGVAVAVGNIDAHVAMPAVGITTPGKLLMIMGTSTCAILLGEREAAVPGICGIVEDGVIPGFLGYEAGQSCVGDHFDWFVKNNVPATYEQEASRQGISIHELLTQKASNLQVGESGLLALDWWNGNRSTLVDADLTGLMVGMTLLTKPEELYLALIEATAYGARMIVEAFREHGVAINEIYACGGITEKNPLMMQIYADVLGMAIKISASTQTPALGSAMFGALAAGKARGGYETIHEAADAMARVKDEEYQPIAKNVELYEVLYQEYTKLYNYFGRGDNDVMKVLKTLRK